MAFLTIAHATNLPIRGVARGEPKIKVGDRAPLIMEELTEANRDGKVIALMLGYPNHCPWCDRMDRYINIMMQDNGNFNDKAVFIQKQIEHAKLIAPPPENLKLKEAYGVEGQPWLFIIDRHGVVRFVYKIYVSSETFKENIEELIKERN